MQELVRQAVVIDYGTLADVLPNAKVFPSDLDGILEISGNFLFLETKFHDSEMPTGQTILLNKLSKLPNCTVIAVVIDKVPTTKPGCFSFVPKKMRIFGIDGAYRNVSLDEFREWFLGWYKIARLTPK